MMRNLFIFFLFFFSAKVSAETVGFFSTAAEAQAACSSFYSVQCNNIGAAGGFAACAAPWTGIADFYYHAPAADSKIWYGCRSGTVCTEGQTVDSSGSCVTPPPPNNCLAGRRHFGDTTFGAGQAATVCVQSGGSNCAVTMTGIPIILGGKTQSTFTETGGLCGTSGEFPPEVTPPAEVPNETGCTKTTLSNGQISYDCGKEAATGISCRSTSSGYECSGGNSGAKCWTDNTGTINCTADSTTSKDATTPVKTESGTKKNVDGTSTTTKTELLPGGGWKTTTTEYDANGTKVGETVESGSGLKDDGENPDGGDGDGTSEPPPEPPTGTLPNSNITLPGFQSSSFLGGSAGCPSPASFNAFGQIYAVSFEPGCQAAGMLRAIMLVFALFLAVRIFQGYVTEAVR